MSLTRQVNNVDDGWEGDLKEDLVGRKDARKCDEILKVGTWDIEDIRPSMDKVSNFSLTTQGEGIDSPSTELLMW